MVLLAKTVRGASDFKFLVTKRSPEDSQITLWYHEKSKLSNGNSKYMETDEMPGKEFKVFLRKRWELFQMKAEGVHHS